MFFQDKKEIQNQWDEFLYRPQYTSVQYLQFKNHGLGSTPIQSYENLMMHTPHVSQPHYSEIETTKRKALDFAKRNVENTTKIRPDQPIGFIYPDTHWSKFTPDGNVFRRFPKFKNPFVKMPLL